MSNDTDLLKVFMVTEDVFGFLLYIFMYMCIYIYIYI